MKAGRVVRLRVNPKDCLGILDILEGAKVDTKGKSFASCTALALGIAIQTLRRAKAIREEEDGFSFLDRMAPFEGSFGHKRKMEYSKTLYQQQARGLELPSMGEVHEPLSAAELERFSFLNDRLNEGVALLPKDQEEYAALNRRFG